MQRWMERRSEDLHEDAKHLDGNYLSYGYQMRLHASIMSRIIDCYFTSCFCARPTTVLFTLVANRKLQSVSPRCAARGERLQSMSVLLEPERRISCLHLADPHLWCAW